MQLSEYRGILTWGDGQFPDYHRHS